MRGALHLLVPPTPPIKLIDGTPRVSRPMNAIGGLYCLVERDRDVPLRTFYPQLKELARKHGFNPDGKVTEGFPSSHGLGTVTNAVWFHDKL